MTFQLDTTGSVGIVTPAPQGGSYCQTIWWKNLTPFTQGYIEALFATANETLSYNPKHPFRANGFSDLAPETIDRIIADCSHAETWGWGLVDPAISGGSFWKNRQKGQYSNPDSVGFFPPLRVVLNESGKVVFE